MIYWGYYDFIFVDDALLFLVGLIIMGYRNECYLWG